MEHLPLRKPLSLAKKDSFLFYEGSMLKFSELTNILKLNE